MSTARKSRENNPRSANKTNAHKNLQTHCISTTVDLFCTSCFFSHDFHTIFPRVATPALVGRLNGEKGASQINCFFECRGDGGRGEPPCLMSMPPGGVPVGWTTHLSMERPCLVGDGCFLMPWTPCAKILTRLTANPCGARSTQMRPGASRF